MGKRTKYDIFISYRASENRQKAEHLYTLLDARFPHQVSYDKETFGNGRWDEQILRRIDDCKDVVVLLTPDTFSAANEEDAPKYKRWAKMPVEQALREIEKDSNVDILRTEVSRAITLGKNIVPIVHSPNGTNFADWSLPSDIAALTRFEGVLYNDNDPNLLMASHIPKIIRLLKTKRRRWWVISSLALFILAIGLFSLWRYVDFNASRQELSRCRKQEEYEKMLGSRYQQVVQAARDSLNQFALLKKDCLYVNVKREDCVPVYWSPSISLLQLRTITGLVDSMMFVEKGEFVMGDKEGYDFDGPEHKVVLTEDYYVSKYELTRDVWYAVMADSAVVKDARYPMTNISFDDVQQFVARLKKLTQLNFSLPTEAEWEYAAKGELMQSFAGGDDANSLAYWKGNSQNRSHPVGGLDPNSRDLYDMSGNVSEWCLDGEIEPYLGEVDTNPVHKGYGDRHVIRGGNYSSDLDDLRVGHREHFKANGKSDVIGMRLIMKKQQ